jgi:hypothetical protein
LSSRLGQRRIPAVASADETHHGFDTVRPRKGDGAMMRCNCCRKMFALMVAAGFMMSVVGCSEWRDAEPRKTGQDSSYKSGKVQGQQWNPSDGSSGTMSEPAQR